MPDPKKTSSLDRRQLLGAVGATAGAALAGRTQAEDAAAADWLRPEWTFAQGQGVAAPPYGQPSRHEKRVRRRAAYQSTDFSSWSFTPLGDLHGIVTPNGLIFERHHGGWPDIDPGLHRLMVHGLVKRPLVFTMDDLLRFPAVSRIAFLECSGNSLSEWKAPLAKTVQESHGLISCCEWTGIPLGTLLQEAGVEIEGKWILAEGADSAAMTRSLPLTEEVLSECLVAYAQNGEALRPQNGYPLRLLMPGWEGNLCIKWLRRLEVGSEPFHTREETGKYTDLMPDGKARQFTFVMEAKSVITWPSGGGEVARGSGEVRGLAWSGRGRVRRVEVSVDSGVSWHEARLDEPVLSKCLTRFRLPWRFTGEPVVLLSRAEDETGYVQPTRDALVAVRGTQSYYHYNAIHGWRVDAEGKVGVVG